MTARSRMIGFLLLALSLTGCQPSAPPAEAPPVSSAPVNQRDAAQAANQAFLTQKTFDPWVLTNTNANNTIPAYIANGKEGWIVKANGDFSPDFIAGTYDTKQQIVSRPHPSPAPPAAGKSGSQILSLRDGTFRSGAAGQATQGEINWPKLWQTSDIAIDGDPEAQQVTHANLFYLLSSTYPGSDHSLPPMGLSSGVYGGHIFWDAEVWMLPALIVQHPEFAKPIVDYRFKRLGQAKKNAAAHGYKGAEYPWESAETGAEVAPAEFAQERHITADVAFAAWQYYLWTGDAAYLKTEGWPLLQQTAIYWVSRVKHGADGRYHIAKVVSPDETAGVVDDDAYTNAVVQYNLRAATAAAKLVGQTADPQWAAIARAMAFPQYAAQGIPAEHAGMTARLGAKQADTLLLIHPLGVAYSPAVAGKMLDFYAANTIKTGPAMTDSIHAIVAAKLGRAQPSLDYFHDSYRPFMRAPWDAFSEKRTTNNVYFLTGMAGCVQSVLYGFAGLQVRAAGQPGLGKKLAGDSVASLYADPHLPPGWKRLVIKGVRFRGRRLDVTIRAGNTVAVGP